MIILLIIVLIILIIFVNILINDTDLLYSFKFIKNNYTPVEYRKRKILIITAENRNTDYIRLHDSNFEKYTKLHNYEYLRLDNCEPSESSTYWCKIFKVYSYLMTDKYDYVMWADSDTIITDYSVDIDYYISNFGEKDIIIGIDEKSVWNIFFRYYILNAGLFLIKNSQIGKKFLKKCIDYINKNKEECIVNNKEQGRWSGLCYEQGYMNALIKNKYSNNVYIDYSKTFIHNKTSYVKANFDYSGLFVHLAGFSNENREIFFKKFIN